MTSAKFDLHKKTKKILVDQIIALEKKLESEGSMTSSQKKEAQSEADRVFAAVEGLNPEGVAQGLASISVSLSDQLSKVSTELQEKARQLVDADQAIRLKQQELETLHGKTVAASALEELIADFRVKEAEFHTTMTAVQQTWEAEQKQHDQEQRDRSTALKLQQEREKDAYTYDLQLSRKTEQANFEDETRARNLRELDRQRELTRTWTEREATLATKETEFTQLRARVDGFDEELQQATEKAKGQIQGILSTQYKHQIALLENEKATGFQIRDAQINSISQQLGEAKEEIVALKGQIATAQAQVKEIAQEALKEAGTGRALGIAQEMQYRSGGSNGQSSKRS